MDQETFVKLQTQAHLLAQQDPTNDEYTILDSLIEEYES